MSLQTVIQSDLDVLVSAMVATGGVVASIMAWAGAQSKSRAEDRARLAADQAAAALEAEKVRGRDEVAQAAQAHAAELAALNDQLRDSASHYKLLERRIGDDVAVVDLTKLTVSGFDMLKLDAKFKPLDDGRFRLRTPPGKGWTHSVISEAQLQRDILVEVPDKLAKMFAIQPAAETQMVHVWRDGKPLRTETADGLDGPPATVVWEMQAQVMAQFVANDALAALMGASPTPADGAAPVENAAAAQRFQHGLSTRFGLAYLMGQIQAQFTLAAVFPTLDIDFETIRQVGRVLYARVKFEYAGPPDKRLTLLREWLVVTVRDGVYLIRIDIPLRDSGSDASAWTNEWLSGLRLPAGD